MDARTWLCWIVAALIGSSPLALRASDASFLWFRYEGSDPEHALVQPGANQFRNPILGGFYPDPSIERVGDDYYMINSTFSWYPGIPIWHSRDLVNWVQIGNAIHRPDQLDFTGREVSQGVFAPAISWHRGKFYIVNTCIGCGDNFIISAADPKGPWSKPTFIPELKWGIDPSLFFDADGTAWLLNNGMHESGKEDYDGHRAIWIQRFDIEKGAVYGKRTMIVNGGVDLSTKPVWIEGPHLFRRGDYYYLTAAEGGTGDYHAQMIFRAKHPQGPYEAWSGNPILTQRDLPADRPLPVTSTGHADPVLTQSGQWWAPFLATRPYEGDIYNTGRETFLLPMEWREDGWPVILDRGRPVPHVVDRPNLPQDPAPAIPNSGPLAVVDEFDGPELGLHWMMMRTPKERWHRLDGGALHLTPRVDALGTMSNPSFWARRQQHMAMEASTMLQFQPAPGEAAGLGIVQRDEYWFAFVVAGIGTEAGTGTGTGRELRVIMRRGADEPPEGRILARVSVPDGPIRLRIGGDGGRYWFDWADESGDWRRLLGDADGTVLSTHVARGFVGAMVGPYATKLAE